MKRARGAANLTRSRVFGDGHGPAFQPGVAVMVVRVRPEDSRRALVGSPNACREAESGVS